MPYPADLKIPQVSSDVVGKAPELQSNDLVRNRHDQIQPMTVCEHLGRSQRTLGQQGSGLGLVT